MENKGVLSQAEINLLQWFRELPCGHRALLESALLVESAELMIVAENRESTTAAARIGSVQGGLLHELAARIHVLSRLEPSYPLEVEDVPLRGQVYDFTRRVSSGAALHRKPAVQPISLTPCAGKPFADTKGLVNSPSD